MKMVKHKINPLLNLVNSHQTIELKKPNINLKQIPAIVSNQKY